MGAPAGAPTGRARAVLFACLGVLAVLLATAPAAQADVGPLSLASAPSPYPPNCNGAPQPGTLYPNSEIEPYIAANPRRPANLIAVWQQDRWSNGGAQGVLARVSFDSGRTWQPSVSPPFSRCAGGNPRNGGDYERASDPWVTFSPNGDAFFMALAVSVTDPGQTAMLVARSRDGGRTWGPIITLISESQAVAFNDKNSITADPTDSRFAYAVWDRLSTDAAGNDIGPTYLTRTTNGGASWETPRAIYDPGPGNQSIGNVIAVLPDGTLLNLMTVFLGGTANVAVLRSTNKGRTWSRPVFIDGLGALGAIDPRDGAPVRDGAILAEIAVDPRRGHDEAYVVWQDARFTGGQRDDVVLSRSTDGGRTWSAPARVSPPASNQAFTPRVEVDSAGRVAVTYFDFTFDTVASTSLDTDYWVVRSRNGGRSFGARERITRASFDLRQAPVAGGFFLGDYMGLTVTGQTFRPLFTAVTAPPDNPTDAFSTRVTGPVTREATAPTAARTAARVAGRAPGTRYTLY